MTMLKSISLLIITTLIACNGKSSYDEDVQPLRILSEKEVAPFDLPSARSFKCPDYTVSVYGSKCTSNEIYQCIDNKCQTYLQRNCTDDYSFFRTCVDKYEYPGVGKLPEKVIKDEADFICKNRGGHLCSQNEWQESCRGAGLNPNGDDYVKLPLYCNLTDTPREAGKDPSCRNAHGVVDIIGNAEEWQSEGTVGTNTCQYASYPKEDKNSFRCCYNPE